MRISESKIKVPDLPTSFVPRDHLLDRLDEAAPGKLVVVIAPPGFGKTTLLSSWLRRTGGPPTAWISLDAVDAASRFRSTLLAAIAGIPGLPPDSPLRQVGQGLGEVSGLDVIDELIEALATTTPAIRVVLDDLQELTTPDPMRDLARIIRSSPAGLQLVLSSRMDPALPLPRLRLEGRLQELRAEDLRFAADDAGILMQAAGLELTPDQISVLVARTEGWAAGLRFAALALRSTDDSEGFIARFSGSEESVAGYLAGEVMASLPAEAGRLLRVAAVCSELPSALAVALFERADAAQVLDDLARGTALVQRTSPETYRIHPLLRTYLATDLESHLPELHSTAHVVAAHWWLEAGNPVHALRHAERAAQPALLRSVLRKSGVRLIAEGSLMAVQRAIDAADPSGVASDPWTALLAALGHKRASASSMAAAALDQARRIWPPNPEPQLRLLRASAEMLVEGGPSSESLMSCPAGCVSAEFEALRDLSSIVASISGGIVDAKDLRRRLAAAAAGAREHGFWYFEAWAHSLRALLEVTRGRYGAMRSAAKAAVAADALHARQSGEWAGSAGALLAYGDLLAGRPQSARNRAEAILDRSPLRSSAEYTLRVVHGTALGDLGERASGLSVCRAARARFGDGAFPPAMLAALAVLEYWSALALCGPATAAETAEWLERRVGKVGEVLLMDAWAHLYAGQYEAAHNAVEPITTGVVATLVPHTPVEVRLVRVESALRAKDPDSATALLAVALARGEAIGVVRPFALATGMTGELLRSTPPTGVGAPFAERLSNAFRAVHREVPAPLSDRELAVLALLPSLLSGGEIADELTVSVNTVKSHIRSIYKKLGVCTRRDAVRMAQERQLIT